MGGGAARLGIAGIDLHVDVDDAGHRICAERAAHVRGSLRAVDRLARMKRTALAMLAWQRLARRKSRT